MVSEMIRHGLSALLLKMHSLILMSICLLKIQWFLSTKQKNGNETSETSLIWLKYSCDSSPFLSWMSPNHIFDTLWLCWSLMFYTIIYKKKKNPIRILCKEGKTLRFMKRDALENWISRQHHRKLKGYH